MICRGFVDLLFILLCSTIVLLAQSIPLRGLLAEPAEAGTGGTRPLHDDEIILVSISETELATAEASGTSLEELDLPASTLLIVPATADITHHRVIDVWRQAREAGFRVELGVQSGRRNMMSRPAIIIGLLLALALHWVLLLPPGKSTRVTHVVPARIAMRELPETQPTEAAEAPAPKPKPTMEPPPPAQPVAQPAPTPPTPRPDPPAASPDLARTATPQRTTLDSKGDFSGDRNTTQRPSLRIDWGSPEQARAIVEVADLRLVMLGTEGGITGEVKPVNSGWQRQPSAPVDLSGYSNRVRIVDSTPAFTRASSLCNAGERLAVLLPLPPGTQSSYPTNSSRCRSRRRVVADPRLLWPVPNRRWACGLRHQRFREEVLMRRFLFGAFRWRHHRGLCGRLPARPGSLPHRPGGRSPRIAGGRGHAAGPAGK